MAKWLENGVPVDYSMFCVPRGIDWIGKPGTAEKPAPIQCYDPPETIAVCLSCTLTKCSGAEGGVAGCPLRGRNGRATQHKGYVI